MALTERLALIIDAKTGGAIRELRKVQNEVGSLQTPVTRTDKAIQALGLSGTLSAQSLRAGLAVGAVTAGLGLLKLSRSAVSASSALREQSTAVVEQFGDAAGAVEDFSDDASSSIGMSERAALQAANNFGTFFDNIGIGDKAAARFSTSLVALAADLGSLKNISNDEAITKLTSGLAGEQEALRRLGIFISEAAVKAKAAELGFKPLNGLFSDQAKVLARLALIYEQTGTAQGNFALTAGDLANSQKTLGAEVENLSAAFGEVLTPAVTETVQGLTDLVKLGGSAVGVLKDLNNAGGGLPSKLLQIGPLGGILQVTSRASSLMGLFGGSTDDAGNAADRARSSFSGMVNEILDVASSVQETTPSLDEMEKALNDVRGVFFGSIDAQDAYENALGNIDDASASAARAHQDLADAQEDQRQTIADLNLEVERNERAVTRSARAVANAQRDLAEANEDLGDAQAKYGTVLEDFHPNSRRAHEALEELEDAERRQEDAQFNAEDSAYDLQEAQRSLADTTQELRDEMNGVGPAADRVRDAQDRVRESSDNLRDAQDNLGRAAVNLEVALAKERTTLAENNDELEAFIGWLDMLKAKYPEHEGFFAGLIWRAAQLRGEVEGLNTALEGLGGLFGLFTNGLSPLTPDNSPYGLVPGTNIGEQPVGKSRVELHFHEKIDPMHAMREAKRQLMPGG